MVFNGNDHWIPAVLTVLTSARCSLLTWMISYRGGEIVTPAVDTLDVCAAELLVGLGGKGGRLLGVVTSIGRGD